MLLHKYEIYFYLFVYISLLSCGLFQLYSCRDQIVAVSRIKFAPGWSWVGRPLDNTNGDLDKFKNYIFKNAHWYVIHIVICELCRVLRPQLRTIAHFSVGLAFLVTTFKVQASFLILLELITFYLASKTCSKTFLWIVAFGWLCGIHLIQSNKFMYTSLGPQELRYLSICLAWSVLKCMSFGLTRCKSKLKENFNLKTFLGYTLYFPMIIHGPVMIFDRYVVCTKETETEVRQIDRFTILIKRLARLAFWLFLMEFALHFVYINYLEQDLDAIKLLGTRETLYAFGYFMGQFFHVYYVITYGLGIAFAAFDGMNPPNQPKCIGYVHRYSNMWKYFDHGLYEFLFQHIYCELCSKGSSVLRKILASLGTFSFVFFWHGYTLDILIWSSLNVICLIVEKFFQTALRSTWYKNNVARRLSLQNQQRLYALVGSQIFIPSAFANFYFFAGTHIGNYFMELSYWSGVERYLWITFYCYCIFQSSEYVGNLSRSKKREEIK